MKREELWHQWEGLVEECKLSLVEAAMVKLIMDHCQMPLCNMGGSNVATELRDVIKI